MITIWKELVSYLAARVLSGLILLRTFIGVAILS